MVLRRRSDDQVPPYVPVYGSGWTQQTTEHRSSKLPPGDPPTQPIPRIGGGPDEPDPPFFVQQWQFLTWAFMTLVAATLLTGLIVWAFETVGLPVPFGFGVLIWLLTLIGSALYAFSVYRIVKERDVTTTQLIEVDAQGQWIPNEAFDKLRFLLERSFTGLSLPAPHINMVTRKHKVVLFWPTIPYGLAGLALFGLAGYITVADPIKKVQHQAPSHLNGALVVLTIVLGLVCTLRAVWHIALWQSEFIMLVNRQLRLLRLPPAWWPTMDELDKEITSLSSVLVFDSKRNFLGRILNYGAITAETPAQGDIEFHDMNFLPNPVEIKRIFNDVLDSLRGPGGF